MILLDVNVLVEAAHRDAARHLGSASWLTAALSGSRPVALAESVLVGCARVLTHPRVFADPLPADRVADFVDAVRTAPAAVVLTATDAAHSRFSGLLRDDAGLRGNLVPDAWLAALALSQGAELATRDRGFRRFPGLRLVHPPG